MPSNQHLKRLLSSKMPEKPVFVFLYTELAAYIFKCMETLAVHGAEVHVMAYPVNPEAPFEFDLSSVSCHYYRRDHFDFKQLSGWLLERKPDVLVCSGWIDKDYVKLARIWRGRSRTVLALDNPYPKKAKGMLALWRARLRFKSAFQLAWVPGIPQVAYARAMGFSFEEISQGFYSADLQLFTEVNRLRPEGQFAQRFLYVGRYVEFKGVKELWSAFAKMSGSGWELHCAGTGAMYEERPEIPGLRHFGFVQPSDLDNFVADGGVFVLPSHHEPWGVVVHEMAAAGLPLICSSAVGAASAFLNEGVNGMTVTPQSAESLHAAMLKMTEKTVEELQEMGRQSAALAATLGPRQWAQTALALLQRKIR
jgi:glycosyltransferase involved in cell wall biosynthesis